MTTHERTKMDELKPYIQEKTDSLVLWNCSHPSNKAITKKLINKPDTTGKYLHRFSWLNDEEIGSLSHQWNGWVGIKILKMGLLRPFIIPRWSLV